MKIIPNRDRTSFGKLKSLGIYSVLVAFLCLFLGCSYKPSYLQKSARTLVAERWQVKKIDPAKLSPDEFLVFEKMGSPQYVRFFRMLSPERERVYEWIYVDPVRLICFVDGKQVAYVVVDEDTSPLNENQKKWLYWGGVATATTAGLGLLYYYLIGSK
ncbi:MAG: hypothetical protein FJ117_12385 [Deltaproteobacteria bacterium]|nr:hypothetical protein [Deltaproteobacteria bacterium]